MSGIPGGLQMGDNGHTGEMWLDQLLSGGGIADSIREHPSPPSPSFMSA
jgi:hypothetical protein